MKVVKAKSDKLLYVRARGGLFAAAVSHFKTLPRAILYLDTFITFKFLFSSCRVFLFLPAFYHKNGPRLLHNHQYTFHARRFHPSFLLFPLSKGPYFTQKIFDISRKISYVFLKTLGFFSNQKEWAEDTQMERKQQRACTTTEKFPRKRNFYLIINKIIPTFATTFTS